jgi:uncharacterized membrane protein YkvA (DUF1232 family)
MQRITPYSIINILRAFRSFPLWIKLIFRLLKDKRVPFRLKFIPLIAFLYVISPIDFIPDLLVPIFGYVDDVAVLFLAFKIFVRLSPRDVVAEHMDSIR